MPLRPLREAFDALAAGDFATLRRLPERARFWRIAESLPRESLAALDPDEPLDADALVGAPEQRGGRLLLGTYSEAGIAHALAAYGLWQELRERAGAEPAATLSGVGEGAVRLQIRAPAAGPLFVEVRLALGPPPAGLSPRTARPFVHVEWLNLQDPRASFTPDRPALPGQEHPGLGKGRQVLEILLILGWRVGAAGLVGHPAWFHNAVLYRVLFRFVDPVEDGRVRALVDAFEAAGLTLAEASRALHAGRVVDEDGEVVRWRPGPMVAPLLPELEFEDAAYTRVAEAARTAGGYLFPPRSAISSAQRPA